MKKFKLTFSNNVPALILRRREAASKDGNKRLLSWPSFEANATAFAPQDEDCARAARRRSSKFWTDFAGNPHERWNEKAPLAKICPEFGTACGPACDDQPYRLALLRRWVGGVLFGGIMRVAGYLKGFLALAVLAAASAPLTHLEAQQSEIQPSETQSVPNSTLQTQTIDLSTLQLAQRDGQADPSIIDFENVQGPQDGVGIRLTSQYEQSHSVTFGRGVSVHFCTRATDDVMQSFCTYPQAASGQRVAAYDPRTGGASAMTMTFSRPVDAVSVRLNPTGGSLDEEFTFVMAGFDANGSRVALETTAFNWFQDAFTWPTSATLKTEGAPFARVSMELRRNAAGSRAVRFLIDDMALVYGVERDEAPVLADLTNERTPPEIVGAEVVQTAETEEVASELRLYPAATRIRTQIDWEAAERAVADQQRLGMAPAPFRGERYVQRMELPLLLPSAVDPDTLSVVGNVDAYDARFELNGRTYGIYGTRVLTVINPATGAPEPPQNIQLHTANHALIASFSLYGASYSITRYCLNDTVAEDPACHDRDEFGEVAEGLVAVIGASGRRRP